MARYLPDDTQTLFVSGSLESLLPQCSVARSLWRGVSSLDFAGFDSKYVNDQEGRPAIEPRRLAAVWMLALLRGVTSSVAVARLCASDIEFRWLSGDCGVEKSTLCAFRSRHHEQLSDLSTQILAGLARSGLLPAKDLSVDGTVIRAAASCGRITNREKLQRRLEHLVDEIRECLRSDDDNDDNSDSGRAALEKQERRLERALAEMEELGLRKDKKVAWTDPEASVKRLKDGSYAPAHNVQAVSDLSSGAIIHVEVVARNNDQGLLLPELRAAEKRLALVRENLDDKELLSSKVESLTADGGYRDTLQLDSLEECLNTFLPKDEHSRRRPPGVSAEYLAEQFVYDAERDELICPEAERLRRRKLNSQGSAMTYQAKKSVCDNCAAKSQCCPTSKGGRNVNVSLYGDVLEQVDRRHDSRLGRWYSRARRVTMEGVFARLTELLHWRRCRCWGKAGATAEALWRMITHNLLLLISHWKPLVHQRAPAG
jgi:transposase